MAKKQEIQDKRFELYERAHTKEYYAVAKWLSEVKFTPAVLGADQADVWRKIEKLCELYEAALDAERARNAKLERKLRSVTAGKRAEPQVKQEQPKAAPAKSAAEVTVKETPVPDKEVKKPVQQELAEEPKTEQARPEPLREEPKPAAQVKPITQEEQILQDLLREFGPKGGEPNG